MKVSAAKDKSVLKKRLQRFFDPSSKRRAGLCAFLDEISDKAHIYIYGGVIRDIALHGVESFNSDIDIVFTGNDSCLDAIWRKYSAQRNSFGGHRLSVGGWQVDIWKAEHTWAFQEGYRTYQSIESLLSTTITNWDAILYDWQAKRIISSDGYFKDLSNHYLDVVLTKNPNMLGMYVRIIRYCAGKAARHVSPQVADLLKRAFEEFSFEELVDYEQDSFKDSYLRERSYEQLTDADLYREDFFPKHLGINLTRPLF